MESTAVRSLVAAGILGPWLLLITMRQTALYAGDGGGPPGAELLPVPVTAALIVVALVVRLARPAVATHIVCLAILVCGTALLAASLGSPFANATASYCGDFCRTAIMGRFLAFFGWPLLAAVGLALAWRAERGRPGPGATDRAGWSRAWIYPTLVLGLAAAAAWWLIVLP
jgi:hypothetical protein